MSMVRSSYIIIVSGMGDDVPILGALVTLLKADGLLLLVPKASLGTFYFFTNSK